MIAIWASLAAIAFSVGFPDLARVSAPAIFISSVFLLGMPHGMVDGIVLFSKKKSGRWLQSKTRIVPIMAYIALAAFYALGWSVAPVASLIFFLILTAIHWGTAEYQPRCNRWAEWICLGASRGALVIIGVLAFQRADSMSVIQLVAGASLELPDSRLMYGLLSFVTLAHSGFLWRWYGADRRLLSRKLVDSVLILFLLAHTPALLGMAVYYMFFHAVRHFGFFEEEARPLLRNSHLVCLLAVFMLLIGIIGMRFNPGVLWGSSLFSIHFVLLAVLTLPHTLMLIHMQVRRSLVGLPS